MATKLGHRTNSLGSAKVDCHTCSQLGSCCDRQRPRCGTCKQNHRDCGGFAMDLTWKDAKWSPQSHQSSANESEHVEPSINESRARKGHERQFKFVKGRQRIKRKPHARRKGEHDSATNDAGNFSIFSPGFFTLDANGSTPNTGYVFGESLSSESSTAVEVIHTVGEFGLPLSSNLRSKQSGAKLIGVSSPYDAAARTLWPNSRFIESDSTLLQTGIASGYPDQSDCSEEPFQEDLDTLTHIMDVYQMARADDNLVGYNATPLERIEQDPFQQSPLSRGILFRDLAHKFGSILTLYNQEFCVLPLTTDCRINPFRIPENRCEGSDFLTHAILATSSHHLSQTNNCSGLKVKKHEHQSMAIRLFGEALSRSSSTKLLDALMILVNFQATQSAFGTWNVHLMGAQKILEVEGVTQICNRSPRIRAQVAILVWWDITVALISRREPLLPEAYLQTLMEYDCNQKDGWTFFILNGCPAELAMAMRRLARLASIYEKASSMEWTTFNTAPVKAITAEVTEWKNYEDVTADEAAYVEYDMDGRRNRFHCTEAWRYAILLYARRVFVQKQDASGLRSINYLTREVLDHIACIPRTAMVQKQALLPMFLAGAEAGDESVRDIVRDYCSYWSVKSGHFMFNTVATLLEFIWADWDVLSRDVYWWGVKVNDIASFPLSGEQLQASELLLG